MPTRIAVRTDKAPPPLPVFSQAIICNGMVYCSGSIGVDPTTKALVDTGIADRTVREPLPRKLMSRKADKDTKAQALKNLSAVLEEAGSSLQNCVKVNVFLTDMANFAAVNKVYEQYMGEPKPVG